jgi:hypothetical protein
MTTAGSLYVLNISAFAVKLLRGAMHLIQQREESNEKNIQHARTTLK